MQTEDGNQKCLVDLHLVNPQDDIARIERGKEKLLDDAYERIFEDGNHASFTNWDESRPLPCRVLWIKGDPGTGKTMLLIGIIRELSHQSAALSPSLSYFFCQSQGKTDPPLDNATAALRSLMWMLLLQQPDLIDHLQTDYKASGKDLFTNADALFALRRIFERIVTDVRLRPVYFIVDALDECDQGSEELIDFISTSLKITDKVRWLVSSRPDILTKLKNMENTKLASANTMVVIDMQSQEDRIGKYIERKLLYLADPERSEFLAASYTLEILAELSREIKERAMNNMLWMSLVFKALQKNRGSFYTKVLEDYPPGLSKLYDHKMTKIENAPTVESQRCMDVLMVTTLVYRPLSLSELTVLLPWGKEIDPYGIVDECDSFLKIEGETISMIHKSSKDYMLNYWSKYEDKVAQGHLDVVRRSIMAMSKLENNIYGLPSPATRRSDRPIRKPDPLEEFEYSCVYWVSHLAQIAKSSPNHRQDNTALVFDFLRAHFLHWVEALSWIERTGSVVHLIMVLIDVFQASFFTSAEQIERTY
jgi:hypothetical protein